MKISHRYITNEETVALIPAKKINYDTIVVEENKTLYVRQTPQEIIEASCKEYWSTYEGRREAVIHHTGFKEKVPIPIDQPKAIVAFPTHAIKHMDCSWLFYHHILRYEAIKDDPKYKTAVTFTNGKMLKLDVSVRTFQTQMRRAFEVRERVKATLR